MNGASPLRQCNAAVPHLKRSVRLSVALKLDNAWQARQAREDFFSRSRRCGACGPRGTFRTCLRAALRMTRVVALS
jgi:hypothetical protein